MKAEPNKELNFSSLPNTLTTKLLSDDYVNNFSLLTT